MPYRRSIATVFALLIAAAAVPASAEDFDPNHRQTPQFGLGVDLTAEHTISTNTAHGFGGIGMSSPVDFGIRMPVALDGGWYLEPRVSFGFEQSVQEGSVATGQPTQPNGQQTDQNGQTGGGSEVTARVRTWSIGGTVQLRKAWRLTDSTLGFAGGEVGVRYLRRFTDTDPDDATGALPTRPGRGIGFSFGPVLGAEHFFSKAFSLGLEAGLIGESRTSEREAPGDSNAETETKHFNLAPKGSIVLRTYF